MTATQATQKKSVTFNLLENSISITYSIEEYDRSSIDYILYLK